MSFHSKLYSHCVYVCVWLCVSAFPFSHLRLNTMITLVFMCKTAAVIYPGGLSAKCGVPIPCSNQHVGTAGELNLLSRDQNAH